MDYIIIKNIKPEDHDNLAMLLEKMDSTETVTVKRPMTDAERAKKYRDNKKNRDDSVTERDETTAKESTKENILINNTPEELNNLQEELINTPKESIVNTTDELKEKEIKKEKEKAKAERRQRREERKFGKNVYGKFKNVFLSDEELEKFQRAFPDWENRIETLSLGIASKGYNYKSHYAALLNWARRDEERKSDKPKTFRDIAEELEAQAEPTWDIEL